MPNVLGLVTHFILLQALRIDQDEPFTIDKGMDQLNGMARSLRRGLNDGDHAGMMMQIKDFAKVR